MVSTSVVATVVNSTDVRFTNTKQATVSIDVCIKGKTYLNLGETLCKRVEYNFEFSK